MDLTAKDAARLLYVSEETIYQWIHNGTLPSYRVGDRYRLNRVELLEWATARKMNVDPEIFRGNGIRPPDLLLTSALKRGGVIYDLACADKTSALRAICDVLPLPEKVDREELHSVLVAREALCSTGIGNGVAIPHPRGPIVLGVSEPQVTLAFLRHPIEYGALDMRPVSILFNIISTTVRIHLVLLSHLMFALHDPDFLSLLDERAAQDRILAKIEAIEANLAEDGGERGPAL
ncbi:MAG: PTS sugar transporter subunit IIA [Candidatus Hydrogenedentes bacterium]|nr:PTS sugar transporter subunit IIA [Candidatus Hydrogenedentota bacterium]